MGLSRAYRGRGSPIGFLVPIGSVRCLWGVGSAYRDRGCPIGSEGAYRVCAMPMAM